MKKSVAEIEQRLESPECKKNIFLVTHQILQASLYAKKMLKIFAQTINDEPKNIFVGGDLKRLRATIRQYKKDQSERIFQSRDWAIEKSRLTNLKISIEQKQFVGMKESCERTTRRAQNSAYITSEDRAEKNSS